MYYVLAERQLNAGQDPNTPRYIIGVKFGTTTGHRARLRSFSVACADAAPMDVQISCDLLVLNNTLDGTGTDVTNQIYPMDPRGEVSRVAAAYMNYTSNPTTVVRRVGVGAFNARGGFSDLYLTDAACPVWGPNETLCVAVQIGTDPQGNNDVILATALRWEEY